MWIWIRIENVYKCCPLISETLCKPDLQLKTWISHKMIRFRIMVINCRCTTCRSCPSTTSPSCPPSFAHFLAFAKSFSQVLSGPLSKIFKILNHLCENACEVLQSGRQNRYVIEFNFYLTNVASWGAFYFRQCFWAGSRWIQVFSPIRIRVLKVRIRPLINLWDLNDGLIRFWRSLTKKDSVKSARYEI